MTDTPTYSEWQRQPLIDEATRLYLLAQQQAGEIVQLRLELKDAIAAYRKRIIDNERNRDDWK